MKLADHIGLALADAAEHDSSVFVLDGDLADSDGAMHFAQRHPQRFLMAGIAEQGMVSTAAGMADCGLKPWVFSFAAFLCYRALDQVRICLSQAKQPVALVGSHAGGLSGRNGKTHAAPNDLALMLSLPNMHVWAPADAGDAALCVRDCLANPAPVYIRTPRKPFAQEERLQGDAAPARWLTPPAPLSLVSTGLATHWAMAALRCLQAYGIEAGLLHCARLKPHPPLASLLQDVERIMVVEDHSRFGGLASLVASQLPGQQVRAFGWPEDFTGKSGSDEALLSHYRLTGPLLAEAIRARL